MINTKIQTLSKAIEDIKTAIREKGQEVLATDTVASLPEKIDKLSGEKYPYSISVLKDTIEGTLEYLYDTELLYVRPYCFTGCINFKLAHFTNLKKICKYAFAECYLFDTLVLNTTELVWLDSANAFSKTKIETGSIFVPDELYEEYKNSELWKTYKSQIKKISEFLEE